jgi:hypothetical protein
MRQSGIYLIGFIVTLVITFVLRVFVFGSEETVLRDLISSIVTATGVMIALAVFARLKKK